jgi:hypothetical protein
MVGNVYGIVMDATTLTPISQAEIFLLRQPLAQGSVQELMRTPPADQTLSQLQTAERRGLTDPQGEFLINSVPTPFPGQFYLIVIRSPGYNLFVIDQARVLPGATMALKLNARLTPGRDAPVYHHASDPAAPLLYRDEEEGLMAGESDPGLDLLKSLQQERSVFATREGLVGGTTANGHVIVERDHFVALPSRRALNANDSTLACQVELSCQGLTVRAPVWDIGPWNVKDDYWNPSSLREMWSELPEGTPEAEAAFLANFNAGYDDGLSKPGRKPTNPAGIDLADGTFWDDLKLTGNGRISVKFLWRPDVRIGDQVQVTATSLNVRATPGGTAIRQKIRGDRGTITSGPQGSLPGSTFYVWWQIQWEDGLAPGWSAENYLEKIDAASPDRILRLAGDLNFGALESGRTTNRILTLYNDGNSPLTVQSISLPDGFSAVWTGATAASSSQEVIVSFSPIQARNYEGSLMVNSDFTSGANTCLLFGTGLAVAPLLSIESPDRGITLTLRGTMGGRYEVQHAPGLDGTSTWQTLTNTTLTSNSFAFTDGTFTNSPRRFYRGIVVRPAP